MRRLFWIALLLGGYFWVVTSGNDHLLLSKGKQIYEALVAWFDDAEIDGQFKKSKEKKRLRRWD